MNPVERSLRSIDGWQQTHRAPAAVFGVIKKFGDDRGSSLAALLAYYGFLSLFPLLLVLTTILGFTGDAHVQHGVIATTLEQFPVYGQQIGAGAPHPLSGNVFALTFGLAGLVYGSLGVAQAAQHAMAQVWNVPGVGRPGFVPRLLRSFALFATLGAGMAVTAAASALVTHGGRSLLEHIAALAVTVVLNAVMFVAAFRILTPEQIPTNALIGGAIGASVVYSALLTGGTALIQHQLRHAQAVYGQYGFVLGLIAWLYLVAQVVLYGAEANVVRARRLWPRSILQPPLTRADEQVLYDIAHQEHRRPEERVGVGFEPDGSREAAEDAQDPTPPSG